MNQPPHSQDTTQTENSPTQMLAHYHQRANEFYQAGNYQQALKELKQALRYASNENDLEVIEVNIKTISQMLQEEEKTQMENYSENPSENQENTDSPPEGFVYQNKLLLLTILVGVLCFTPIIMKLIERFTHAPVQQEASQTPVKPPAETATKTETAPVVAAAPVSLEATVLKNSVNLREQASTQSTALGRLALNEKVKVLEDKSQTAGGYTWSKIQTASGQVGWVSAAFLQTGTTTETAPVAVENPPSDPAVTTETATTTTAVDPAVQTPASTTPVVAGNLKKVNSAGVSLRSGPSVTQSLITTLPADTEIEVLQSATVTADGLTWSQIKTSQGTIGWMASKFIAP
ncbi:MAG: SH3 domain-containing protein [Candidatus Sericytochromatia bacterium]